MRKTVTVIVEFCGFEIELDVKIDNPPDDDFEVVDITDPHEEVTGLSTFTTQASSLNAKLITLLERF